MIGEKPDRRDYRVGANLAKIIADIGLEPRLAGRAASTLVDELPVGTSDSTCDRRAGTIQFVDVRARLGHRKRNTMRGENQTAFGNLGDRRADAIGHRFNKGRMSGKWP